VRELYFGIVRFVSSRNRLSTRGNGAVTECNYKKFNQEIQAKSKPERYEGVPKSELDELAPHHGVPRRDARTPRCIDTSTGKNVCEDARQILEDVGMDFDDACNGVLLPRPGKSYPAFSAKYPNAILHDTTNTGIHSFQIYNGVFEKLQEIKLRFSPVGTPPPFDRKKLAYLAICSTLQDIGKRMLEGNFP
jgi:A nuclease family of the HNH/ENDO VII superfamily with conserved AHH